MWFRGNPLGGLLILKNKNMEAALTTSKHINFYVRGEYSVSKNPGQSSASHVLVRSVPLTDCGRHIAIVYSNGCVNVVPQWVYLDPAYGEADNTYFPHGCSTRASISTAGESDNQYVLFCGRTKGQLHVCVRSLNNIEGAYSMTTMGSKLFDTDKILCAAIINSNKKDVIGNHFVCQDNYGVNISATDYAAILSLI